MTKILNFKNLVIIMGILIILGLADTTGFFKIDNHLSAFQFITLLLGIYALLSIIEVISVARAEKERARNFKDSSVGKKGIVLNDCSPEGTVKIGQEIWKALTASGSTLKKGEEIIIRDRQGLRVIIEPLFSQRNERE